MSNEILIVIIIITFCAMTRIITRDRSSRDNRIAFIRERAMMIERNIDTRTIAHDKIGIN